MGIVRRIAIVCATVGWLVPLCLSYWATHDFLRNVVWPAAAFDQPSLNPWHPFDLADELFYVSALWLAGVLLAWSIALTGNSNGRR